LDKEDFASLLANSVRAAVGLIPDLSKVPS
jgi:hypothetical protein